MDNKGERLKQTSPWKCITISPPATQTPFELMATFAGWQEENQPFKTGNDPVTDTITAVKEEDTQPVHRLQFNY